MDRPAIRAVALEAFARQGYHATTLRALARELGVTPAALYYHYDTKESLLSDLLTTFLEDSVRELRQTIADASGSGFREAMTYHALSHCINREQAFVVQQDARALSGKFAADVDDLLGEYEGIIAEVTGNELAPVTLAGTEFVLLVKSVQSVGMYAAHWYKPHGELSASQVATQLAEMAAGMVRQIKMRSST